MIDFDKEHPEVVRLMAKWLHGQTERLEKENKILRERAREIEKQEQLRLAIADRLLAFRKLIFGSSEKRPGNRPRGGSEEELLLHAKALLPPPKEKE